MKRRFIVGTVLLVAAAAVAGYQATLRGVPVETAEVARGEIREFVDERGKTRLPETHLITMPYGARIEAIRVREGDKVEAGQVVARVVTKDIEDELAEAQAAVERLEAQIIENDDVSVEQSAKKQAELYVESMVSTVAAADARQTAGRSRMDYAETFLGRVNKLFQTGTETQDELDRAQLSYIESQVGYRQDVLTVESLKSLQAATDLLPQIIADYVTRKGLTHNVLQKQKAEAIARLNRTVTRQDRSVMKSPVSGVVLERLVRDEQHLAGGTVLLRIGELDRLEVEAEVLSEDVVNVQVGDPCEIYGAALTDTDQRGVSGVVDRVYPVAFTKTSSLGVEQQRVIVVVRFAEGEVSRLREERNLGVDYRVRVKIFTDAQANTLLVPRSALFRGVDGEWQVFKEQAGRAARVTVELGLRNDRVAEVTNGLTERDKVILAPESSLRDGMRVSTR